jgi:hypothetical protein
MLLLFFHCLMFLVTDSAESHLIWRPGLRGQDAPAHGGKIVGFGLSPL